MKINTLIIDDEKLARDKIRADAWQRGKYLDRQVNVQAEPKQFL